MQAQMTIRGLNVGDVSIDGHAMVPKFRAVELVFDNPPTPMKYFYAKI
jgi:hypothetical protein